MYYDYVDFWTLFTSASLSTIATVFIGLFLGRQFVNYLKQIATFYALFPFLLIIVPGLLKMFISLLADDSSTASEISANIGLALLNFVGISKIVMSELAGMLAGIVITFMTNVIRSVKRGF